MEVVADSTIPAPAGAGFLPFGLTTTSQTSLYRNTRSLTGDLPELARPQANASFSYVHAVDGLLTISGPMKLTRPLNYETDVACSVGTAADARSLHPDLEGTYLPVTCNGKDRGGPAFTRTYAYLPGSTLYVLLDLTTDGRRENYKISGVEYAK